MNMRKIILLIIVAFFSCSNIEDRSLVYPDGKTIGERIEVPEGFERIDFDKGSYASYLRMLELRPNGSKVKLFNGKLKNRQDVHVAVVDISVGKRDLQQCADAIMRLRAEYLWQQKKFDKIQFNFSSGHTAKYIDWAEGKRPDIKGNNVEFKFRAGKDYSYKNFLKYMETIFIYCGSFSLEKELTRVHRYEDIEPGDAFIQGGFPGHAVIVVDVALNKTTGEKIFLLAQSYMPAQEIHILRNFNDSNLSPWYSAKTKEVLQTPEWDFKGGSLKRFKN